MKYVSLLVIAAFTAWSAGVVSGDMATRKIPNASIIAGLKLLGAALLLAVLCTALGAAGRLPDCLPAAFYGGYALHLLWTVSAGLLLWYSEIWPAGDAKFFMVLSAALPLAAPALRNFPETLFVSLLINIFVAAGFWAVGNYAASGLYRASFEDLVTGAKELAAKRLAALPSGWALAAALFGLAVIFLAQQVFTLAARGALARFVSRPEVLFFFIFIAWEKVGRAFRSKAWNLLAGAGMFAYIVAGWLWFPAEAAGLARAALGNLFKFSLILIVGRFMLEFLLEKKDIVALRAEELKPGMVLSSKERAWMRESAEYGEDFEDSFRDGLTPEQVELVAAWLRRLPPGSTVETVTGRPFALWIAVGAGLTFLFGGGAMHFSR